MDASGGAVGPGLKERRVGLQVIMRCQLDVPRFVLLRLNEFHFERDIGSWFRSGTVMGEETVAIEGKHIVKIHEHWSGMLETMRGS